MEFHVKVICITFVFVGIINFRSIESDDVGIGIHSHMEGKVEQISNRIRSGVRDTHTHTPKRPYSNEESDCMYTDHTQHLLVNRRLSFEHDQDVPSEPSVHIREYQIALIGTHFAEKKEEEDKDKRRRRQRQCRLVVCMCVCDGV